MKLKPVSRGRLFSPRKFLVIAAILLQSGCSVFGIRGTEEPVYSVLKNEEQFQVREYGTLLIAETTVESDFKAAGNIAFRRLFAYISGANERNDRIDMTAPVMALDENQDSGETIAMTAPVTGEETATGWRYAFILPRSFSLASAPTPDNPQIELKEVSPRKVAIVRYSGSSSEQAYEENLALLQNWMQTNKLEADSLPRFAGYDPPWTLSFRRRNEILIDLKG